MAHGTSAIDSEAERIEDTSQVRGSTVHMQGGFFMGMIE
jgi:hypothetical protein